MTHDETVEYYMVLIERHGIRPVISLLVSIIRDMTKKGEKK